MVSFLKKSLKAVMWLVIGIVLLVIAVILIIQIPAVQTRLTEYAVSLVTSKTHTRVELDKISISFPKSVLLKGVYLDDKEQDTLFYAAETKINLNIVALLRKEILINSFSLEGAYLNINRSKNDSLFNYDFLMTAFSDTSGQEKVESVWSFSLGKASLTNIRLRYDDEYGDIEEAKSIFADISRLEISNAEIGFQPDMKIEIGQIDLDETSLAYIAHGPPVEENTFDPSELRYEHINLAIADIYYTADKAEASVENFSAVDQNNFSIEEFETVVSMDPHSISIKKLQIKTAGSYIDADVNFQYSSLASLKDSIQTVILNADMREVSLKTSDINYFLPELNTPAFFSNGNNITSISGIVNGTLNQLNGKNMIISTGANTVLETDFAIDGLPDFETALFSFPNLKLQSGRQDIEMIAGPLMPVNIELPAMINAQVSFNGQIKAFKSKVDLNSSFGSADVDLTMGSGETYSGKVRITEFDMGELLKDKETFGPVTLTADLSGQGFDMESIRARIEAEVSQVYFNQYNYHNLSIHVGVDAMEFEGKINLNDENAVLDLEGLVNLNPNRQVYALRLNVPGADLKKLNLIEDDIQISLSANANLENTTEKGIIGDAGINNMTVSYSGENYVVGSLLYASINEPDTSDLSHKDALIGINFNGNFLPADFPAVFGQFINNYFPFSEEIPVRKNSGMMDFDFEIKLHNHSMLTDIFLPGLEEFIPGAIQGSFDETKNELKLNAAIKRINYEGTEINDFILIVNSDVNELKYDISTQSLSVAGINLDNVLLEGKLGDQSVIANISSNSEQQDHKLLLKSQIVKHEGNYRFTLDPAEFFLFNKQWDLAADHYVDIGKQGFIIHKFFMKDSDSQINISSVNEQFNDDLNISIRNLQLDDISLIMEADSTIIKGYVDGNILLKRIDSTYGLIADTEITDLFVYNNPIGNLSLKTETAAGGKIDIEGILSGTENNLIVKGSYVPGGEDNSLNIDIAIETLAMKTVEAFSFGQISEASGTLAGNLSIQGNFAAPQVTGELTFKNASFNPAVLNSRLEVKDGTIQFNENEVVFNSLTLLDMYQNTAKIDGNIQMQQFKDFKFDLNVNTKNFLLFNTTGKDNKEFFGRMIIDSNIDVSGPMTLPVINARLKIKDGSNFTFAVPEDELTTDKGENVVEFSDSRVIDSIMLRSETNDVQKKIFKGLDISSIIEIDKQATLKLIMDPASTDSLVVKGEAALSFALDRSGKMSLTGMYSLSEGSYQLTLQSIAKRKFEIVPGSTIRWNGDPTEANISIDAMYTVRASPFNLVAGQMMDMSDADRGGYKNRYPFLVLLKLRGAIMQPEMSFEIQLPPEEKGILGGVVNQKLNLLNEDESALNKQVFALLVLGRFIQENPLETEAGGSSTLVRSTVGSILTSELNQFSSKLFPEMDLNFEIQSYNDYQSGQAEGRTQVEIGFKKQLFNERLSIQLGGLMDVEGEKARQNTANDITSDVTIEYKLTKDGRLRLKAFRHNQYESVIEGQLVETGAGLLFVRNFDKWKNFFKRHKKTKAPSKTK